MNHQLSFQQLHEYDPGKPGISVPLVLQAGSVKTAVNAYVDTGSVNCFFSRAVGEQLDLPVESGLPKTFSTAGGFVKGFGHFVTLEALGISYDAMFFFAADMAFQRNLLGRVGWLDRTRMGLIDYEGKLFLNEYQGN